MANRLRENIQNRKMISQQIENAQKSRPVSWCSWMIGRTKDAAVPEAAGVFQPHLGPLRRSTVHRLVPRKMPRYRRNSKQ